MLSRLQFESASKAFARRHCHWSWVDGHRPGYGYLSRTTSHFRKSPISQADDDLFTWESEDLAEEDLATATAHPPALTVGEYIVYSASFSVPAFYFTAHDTTGTPCPLADILETSFFKGKPHRGMKASNFALTLPSTPFPLLSQGDHPTLGIPCWYFHPCESATAVGEFMAEVEQADWTEEMRLVRWLELWLMIVGSVLQV